MTKDEIEKVLSQWSNSMEGEIYVVAFGRLLELDKIYVDCDGDLIVAANYE